VERIILPEMVRTSLLRCVWLMNELKNEKENIYTFARLFCIFCVYKLIEYIYRERERDVYDN